MSTTMLRVPNTLKDKLADLQAKLNCKTQYEVIERLIDINDRLERTNLRLVQEAKQEQERQAAEMIQLGVECKKDFEDWRHDMRVTPDQAVELLLSQWSESPGIGQLTFGLYKSFRKGG